jgi:ribosome-interacting GTPase 1
MLSVMPKHKGTDRLRAELRTKIARFSEESERKLATSRRGSAYNIPPEGAGQVILVGLPNAGKSQLITAVTEASPNVADYPFTTKGPTPAMMMFEDVPIQLVDIPPIIDREARPWLSNLLRGADLLLLMVDLSQEPIGQLEAVIEELEKLKIRPTGLREYDDEFWLHQSNVIIVGNKIDLEGSEGNLAKVESRYNEEFPIISISATKGPGLEQLKQEVYKALDIIRVYTKAPGQKTGFGEPMIMKRGSTVKEAARSVHKDFQAGLKYALVWGSGKYDGQKVKREHVLEDGDVIELHI